MTTPPTQPTWPDSHTFWRDKRVIVTGPAAARRTSGGGFRGAFGMNKLSEQNAAVIICDSPLASMRRL